MSRPVTSAFSATSTALEVVRGHDLAGRVAIVTGGAGGVGLETSRALAAAGAHVVLAVRRLDQGAAAVADIRASHPGASLDVAELDLADLASVRRCGAELADRHDRVHLLINNAAVMATPFSHTADGFEMQFGTNHLGHFALFHGLTDPLRRAGGARVVALSSIGHRRSPVDLEDPNFEHRPYDKWVSYGASKTACSLFAVEVTRRFAGEGILANAVHPGGIATGLQKFVPEDEQRAMGWIDEAGVVNPGFKSPAQGASTSVWAAVGEELEGLGGLYLEDCHEAAPWNREFPWAGVMDWALDPETAESLWELSARLVA